MLQAKERSLPSWILSLMETQTMICVCLCNLIPFYSQATNSLRHRTLKPRNDTITTEEMSAGSQNRSSKAMKANRALSGLHFTALNLDESRTSA